MTDLRFQKLHLVSHRERRARTIEFDPIATVIKGGNDVGKSSIAKSIYGALGAPAAVEHPRWKSAAVSSLLQFSIDGAPHAMLSEGRTFTLFRGNERIGSYTSVTTGVGPALADILGCHLKLTDREGKLVTPPPAYLFLPFYCDQDAGWVETWASFANLRQFSRWKAEVINYHTGITGPEYFEAMELLTKANAERSEPAKELDGLTALRKRAAIKLADGLDFEIDSQMFAEEISLLVRRADGLAATRERARHEISKLTERRLQLTAQREILERVRHELHADYVYATGLTDDEVECPTCGQLHENSFGERFAIAQDEAKTSDLLIEILDGLTENGVKLSGARAGLERVTQEEVEIRTLLTRKKGEVTFASLLERAGNRTFSSQLEAQIEALQIQVSKIDLRITEAKEQIDFTRSADRKEEILREYMETMGEYLRNLKVTSLSESDFSKIDCVLRETGSDRPRAILAYMFAILHLVWSSEKSFRCPIVLDSPNQQDQDAENHLRMLEFIRDNRPHGSQLIIFAVSDCDVNYGGKCIRLEETDFALSSDLYDEVSSQLLPYQS